MRYKIKEFQLENGLEFLRLSKFFKENAIIHRGTCPYTHQNMGKIEWWHRHIVDMGITLRNQEKLNNKF